MSLIVVSVLKVSLIIVVGFESESNYNYRFENEHNYNYRFENELNYN